MSKAHSGFTLIELIMVLVIVGVLAAVVGPRVFVTGTFDARGFHDETLALMRFAHMVQRTGHALQKLRVGGHALGADHAIHPLREAVAQQAEVVAVQLGRVGLLQRLRVDGRDHRVAVIFIEAGPLEGLHVQP